MVKQVVLFTGKARSGKDTSSQILTEMCHAHGVEPFHTYFARILKDSCGEVFGLTNDEMYGSKKETIAEYDFSIDLLVTNLKECISSGSLSGVPNMLDLTPDQVFSRLMVSTYKALQEDNVQGSIYLISPRKIMQLWGTEIVRESLSNTFWIDCVITDIGKSSADVAFVTDARFDNEVVVLKESLHIPTIVVKIVKPDVQQINSHASENGIDESLVDITIINDGTIEDLEVKLKTLFEKIRL